MSVCNLNQRLWVVAVISFEIKLLSNFIVKNVQNKLVFDFVLYIYIYVM
jgi:hypothetical protein